MKTPATTATLEISAGYPTANYPYGLPVLGRTVWHVNTIAKRDCPPGSLFPSLPVASWVITKYDDQKRKYHARHASDFSVRHFTATSFSKAIAGIMEAVT